MVYCFAIAVNNDIDKRNGTWDLLMSFVIYNILILTLA